MEKLLGICSRDLYKWCLCCRKENGNFVLQSQAGENVEWGVSVGVATNINSTVLLFIKIKIQITLVCGIRARDPEWIISGVLRTGNAKAEGLGRVQVLVRRDKPVPQTSTLRRAVGLLLFLWVTADHRWLGGIAAALITRFLTGKRTQLWQSSGWDFVGNVSTERCDCRNRFINILSFQRLMRGTSKKKDMVLRPGSGLR